MSKNTNQHASKNKNTKTSTHKMNNSEKPARIPKATKVYAKTLGKLGGRPRGS